VALTGMQKAFVTAYIDGGMTNAAAAYRIAYPGSLKWAPKTVANKAYELLNHGEISGILAELRAKATQKLEQSADRYAVSKERLSRELARLAFADARKFFDWGPDGVTVRPSQRLTDDEAAAVIEVSQTTTAEGGTIRVKLADKRAALMDLAKLHGHIVDRKDVRVIKSYTDLSDEELAALAEMDPTKEQARGTRH
jgi:phage terminase small subunit